MTAWIFKKTTHSLLLLHRFEGVCNHHSQYWSKLRSTGSYTKK